MDLFRSMQTFCTVARVGSMTAAAPHLGLTPAMVGQHIAALEERLGTRLLNRTTRRQSLTNFGLDYLEQCRDILELVAVSEEQAATLQQNPRGMLRIAAPMTFGAEILVPALGQYQQEAPEVRLDIVLANRPVDIVEEGFDVSFHVGTPPDTRIIARRLASYRLAICASPEYLARRGVPAHPRELKDHSAILATTTSRSSWHLTKGEERVEIIPRHAISLNSGQAIKVAACVGLGVIIQPTFLVHSEIADGRLVQLFPDWQFDERSLSLSLLYYRDRRMTPSLRSFITFATRAFSRFPTAVAM